MVKDDNDESNVNGSHYFVFMLEEQGGNGTRGKVATKGGKNSRKPHFEVSCAFYQMLNWSEWLKDLTLLFTI